MSSRWLSTSLRSLVSYIGKGIVPKYVESEQRGSMVVLGQRCVRNQTVDYGQARLHDGAAKHVKNEKHVQQGDILINATGVGSAGRVAQVVEQPGQLCTTDGHVITLRASEGIDPYYLGYFLKSKQAMIEQMAEGSTGQTEMNRNRLQDEIMVTYPEDLSSQRAIASIGLNLDSKIAINSRLNDYLLELATTLFEHALDKSRTEVSLGDIVDLEDSKRIPLNSRDRAQHKGPYPYYGATAIMDYVDDYLFDGIRILLGEDGTVISDGGKPILQYVWGKYWVNNHAHILKASSIYPLEEIYIALSRTTIKHIVTGAVQMKISQRNLKNLRLTMPGPDAISNLSDLFEMYRQNVEENKTLEALRGSILPKLMSGEIDVSQVETPMQLNNHLPAD